MVKHKGELVFWGILATVIIIAFCFFFNQDHIINYKNNINKDRQRIRNANAANEALKEERRLSNERKQSNREKHMRPTINGVKTHLQFTKKRKSLQNSSNAPKQLNTLTKYNKPVNYNVPPRFNALNKYDEPADYNVPPQFKALTKR